MTPIDPLFLVVPLVASLLSSRSKPNADNTKIDTSFSQTLDIENDPSQSRSDRFLPLDDLIVEASRTEGYKMEQPFAEVVKGKTEEKVDVVEGGEWMGNEDAVKLCQLVSVRERLKDACETQCESFYLVQSSSC